MKRFHMRKLLLLSLLAVLALAACGGDTKTVTVTEKETTEAPTTTEEAPEPETTDCDDLGINRQERNTGTCELEGRKYKVVNRDQLLRLPDVNVKLEGIELTKELAGGYESLTAQGTFAVVTLTATNKLTRPATFDESEEQVGLLLGDANFTQSFEAANGPDEGSCLWMQDGPVQPSGSITCNVIFDVPDKYVGDIEKNGNLVVVPFADANSSSNARPSITGQIRTYE